MTDFGVTAEIAGNAQVIDVHNGESLVGLHIRVMDWEFDCDDCVRKHVYREGEIVSYERYGRFMWFTVCCDDSTYKYDLRSYKFTILDTPASMCRKTISGKWTYTPPPLEIPIGRADVSLGSNAISIILGAFSGRLDKTKYERDETCDSSNSNGITMQTLPNYIPEIRNALKNGVWQICFGMGGDPEIGDMFIRTNNIDVIEEIGRILFDEMSGQIYEAWFGGIDKMVDVPEWVKNFKLRSITISNCINFKTPIFNEVTGSLLAEINIMECPGATISKRFVDVCPNLEYVKLPSVLYNPKECAFDGWKIDNCYENWGVGHLVFERKV